MKSIGPKEKPRKKRKEGKEKGGGLYPKSADRAIAGEDLIVTAWACGEVVIGSLEETIARIHSSLDDKPRRGPCGGRGGWGPKRRQGANLVG